ncbi:MAG: endonuclease III [Ignavibacteria bacterium]
MPVNATLTKILNRLEKAYPDARVGLDFSNPVELLIATILSAQCTDARVNIVTKQLFAKYRRPEDYVHVSSEELQADIRPTGFFKNKAHHIKQCCAMLIRDFNGQVPSTMDDLLKLPGVGRKTANCVLSNCFNIPGITVDTHVIRVSNRLGLVDTPDPIKIELLLSQQMLPKRWNQFNHLIITHGRTTCVARRPRCSDCAVSDLCPSAFNV